MNDNGRHTETIINYLDGELTGEDLKQFEALLAADDAVRQELENLQLAQNAVRSYGLKAQVASVHGEMMAELGHEEERPATIYRFMRPALRIAASLLVLLSAIGVYEYATVSAGKLYSENYQQYQESVSRGAAETSPLEKAYLAGNPALVISLSRKMDSTTNKVKFLTAQSYLATHQYLQAMGLFYTVINSPSSDGSFKDDAEYYLALSYMGYGKAGRAEPIFQKIYDDKDHPYHDRVSYWTLLKVKLLALKNPGK